MKRRVEDLGGSRPEATSAVIGGHLGGSGGYARAPPAAPSSVPGGNPPIGISHQQHQPHIGYGGTKVEMHTGVHHSISNYGTTIATGGQQGSIGIVDPGRSVVSVPSGIVGSAAQMPGGGPGSLLSTQHVLQHGTPPTAIVRPRVNAGGLNHSPSSTVLSSGVSAMTAVTGNNQVAGQFQRLKVEDALSYLDQVKLQFGRQPQVYNDFLDIMKEFKSQSIDTPGVIARVSQLFRGHPELIVGFNTFLPPGYKIEVSVTEPGKQTTVVHTPQGIHHHVTSTCELTTTGQTPTVAIKAGPTVSNLHVPSPRLTNMVVNSQHNTVTIPAPTLRTVITPNNTMTSDHPVVSVPVNVTNATNAVLMTSSGIPLLNSIGDTKPCKITNSGESPSPVEKAISVSIPGSHHHPSVVQAPSVTQPVEFNHAINYVNKIKLRFQGQPDIYKQFLEILHTYQKEQKYIKEGGSMPARTLTESEVYEKVAILFESQEDLLQEFGQFLPDATNSIAAQAVLSDFMDQYCSSHTESKPSPSADVAPLKKQSIKVPISQPNNVIGEYPLPFTKINCGGGGGGSAPLPNISSIYTNPQLKRPLPPTTGPSLSHSQPPTKKPKLNYLKDMSAAEAGKYATLSEYAFFDRVRKALRHEETYHNFLRCVTLFNEEIISRSELIQMIHPFLAKFPELLKWFKDFIGYREGAVPPPEIIPAPVAKQERIVGDLAMEVDYTTCKRLGASYCAQPTCSSGPICSGRTPLCREVLNDTWVSFPSWSEDSTFVTSRKTQYEEYIYRCEDERFELDVVLETNLSTIRLLEGVQKKLSKLGSDELKDYKLDDTLGGSSSTISQRAIKRIYGDKAVDIIDGLKKNPAIAVPLVLRRLKAKDEEWRDAQKGFNKIWRDLNERYYLKSLDHQGLTFKQNDVKTLRSKVLLNDIETLYDERHEQAEEGGVEIVTGPHMVLTYKDRSLLDDAANLIIHHVRRQTIHKEDKAKIKQVVRQFLPDLFFHPRMDLSDDEKDNEDDDDEVYEDEEDVNDNSETKTDDAIKKEDDLKPEDTLIRSSNKRKTRSNKAVAVTSDSEESTTKVTKETSGVIGVKEKMVLNKVSVNGDVSEAERNSLSVPIKTEIKCEPMDDFKPQVFSTACSSLADDEYRLFMGNNNWYLFLRLHQILCHRLKLMYDYAIQIAADEVKQRKVLKESVAAALRLKPKNEIPVEDYYPALLDMVQNMLDGNIESPTFEDTLREMFGIHAYNAFTLDKVISGTVRQLQHIVCDDVPSQCMSMYIHEARKGGAGGPITSNHKRLQYEQSYQRRNEKLLTDENCFKIFTYKKDNRITIELLDTESEGSEENGGGSNAQTSSDKESTRGGTTSPLPRLHSVIPNSVAQVEGWSDYLQNYANSASPQFTPAVQAQLARKPVFLPRNLRSYNRKASKKNKTTAPDEGSPLLPPSPVKPDEEANLNSGGGQNQLIEVSDNTQCKFNLNNYKMVYVVNSDSFMYKELSLTRAKQSHATVTKRKRLGLDKWSKKWSDANVTAEASKATIKWFMGHSEGLLPNRTKVKRIDRTNKTPYFPFDKYKCELLITKPENASS